MKKEPGRRIKLTVEVQSRHPKPIVRIPAGTELDLELNVNGLVVITREGQRWTLGRHEYEFVPMPGAPAYEVLAELDEYLSADDTMPRRLLPGTLLHQRVREALAAKNMQATEVKLAWYVKLKAKLGLIASGDLTVARYAAEVEKEVAGLNAEMERHDGVPKTEG